MPSPSTDVMLSCPFSSLNLHPFVIGDPHCTILVDEEESGCPENIPYRVPGRNRLRSGGGLPRPLPLQNCT